MRAAAMNAATAIAERALIMTVPCVWGHWWLAPFPLAIIAAPVSRCLRRAENGFIPLNCLLRRQYGDETFSTALGRRREDPELVRPTSKIKTALYD